MSRFFMYEDRLQIQQSLTAGLSFKKIAVGLGKDPTTVAREVKKYSTLIATGRPGFPHNDCKHRVTCRKKDVCGKACTRASSANCRLCQRCNEVCTDFFEEVCTIRFKPPYVCNGCSELRKCTLTKTFYDAEKAHLKAHQKISESRSGLCISEEEIARLNAIISPLVRQGQSIHQICINHRDELMCSEKTIYNYVDACLLDIRNIDLPRKVRFRPRYKKPEFKVDRACRNNRTFEDYEHYIKKHPDISVVQMDSVIGNRGGKCLLTIHFVDSCFMLAFLRDANTARSVVDIFNELDKTLGPLLFEKLFPVLLGDNGSEFSNPKAIEYRKEQPILRTHVFYCDAGCPYQKPEIEVNHELIRRILPKGTSFDDLTQNDVVLMMNHINSYKRKKLNDRSPYEMFSFVHGEGVLQLLGCASVAADDIMLKPALLKK